MGSGVTGVHFEGPVVSNQGFKFGTAASSVAVMDASGNYLVPDDKKINIGTDSDVSVSWISASSKVSVLPATNDTGSFDYGNGAKDMDVRIFLGSTLKYVRFDVGSSAVFINDVYVQMGDGDPLNFGDGNDVGVNWTGSILQISPVTDDVGSINVGDGTKDIDLKAFLGDTLNYVLFDVSAKLVTIANSQAGGDSPKALLVDVDVLTGTAGYRQGAIQVTIDRAVGQQFTAGWDGNPDNGVKIIANNRANNLDGVNEIGGIRALDAQARNRGTNLAWVKAIEFNGRNDSGCTVDSLSVVHLRAENYGTVNDSIVALDIEMSSENDTSSPTKQAILVRNTDLSGMTVVDSVLAVSNTSTNGFGALVDLTGLTAANGTLISTSGSAATTWAGRIRVLDAAGAAAWINIYSTSGEA